MVKKYKRSQHDSYFSFRRRRELSGKPFASMQEYYQLKTNGKLITGKIPYQNILLHEGINGLRRKKKEIEESLLKSNSVYNKIRFIKIIEAMNIFYDSN